MVEVNPFDWGPYVGLAFLAICGIGYVIRTTHTLTSWQKDVEHAQEKQEQHCNDEIEHLREALNKQEKVVHQRLDKRDAFVKEIGDKIEKGFADQREALQDLSERVSKLEGRLNGG